VQYRKNAPNTLIFFPESVKKKEMEHWFGSYDSFHKKLRENFIIRHLVF